MIAAIRRLSCKARQAARCRTILKPRNRFLLHACSNPDAVDEIATKLVPENFFRPAHQLIYAGILELNTRHIPIDQISLADRLAAEGQLEAVGGRPYLVELANNTLALTNWKNHTEIVKRNSVLRDLVYASTNINALAYDAPDDTNEVIEDAEKMLFEVTQKRVSSSFQNITDLLTQAFDEIDRAREQQKPNGGHADRFYRRRQAILGLARWRPTHFGRATWCW